VGAERTLIKKAERAVQTKGGSEHGGKGGWGEGRGKRDRKRVNKLNLKQMGREQHQRQKRKCVRGDSVPKNPGVQRKRLMNSLG